MAVDWSYYDKFEHVTDKYLPAIGEGDNMATQIVTAVSKLVYKWYNDGDVFDNTGSMEGWGNDLSSFANWLAKYTFAKPILEYIWSCNSNDDYEDLLRELADTMLDEEDLERFANEPKVGSIYECEGPYVFEDYEDEEEEIW